MKFICQEKMLLKLDMYNYSKFAILLSMMFISSCTSFKIEEYDGYYIMCTTKPAISTSSSNNQIELQSLIQSATISYNLNCKL